MKAKVIEDSINMSDIVYTKLKNQIINLNYRFGQKLNDSELALKFEVSRTPIREALSKLERDGFVLRIPNVGYFLRQFSLRDIKDLYYVRGLLEISAVKLAIKNLDSEKINRLHQIVSNARVLLEEDNLEKYTMASWQMHKELVSYCDNKLLYQLISHLSEKLIMAARLGFSNPDRLFISQEEHEILINYLQNGQAKVFINYLKRHIANAERNTLESIVENPDRVFI